MAVSGTGDHQVVDFDPAWITRAEELMAELATALGPVARRIDHIGSTAVPGLAARPIIDIQISVADIRDTAAFIPLLEAAGYKLWFFGELQDDDYFVFANADGSNTEHVNVCGAGSAQEERHLAIRDYLRANDRERESFEGVKRRSADLADGRREKYSGAKSNFTNNLEARALAWYRGQGSAV
jgi:GrpB-like predicted nucleotidyltransferase (UPF0157 family)